MTLLITIFLVLVNIFNTITTNIPKAEGLTAIEAWVIGCVLFVFGALIGIVKSIIIIYKKLGVLLAFSNEIKSFNYLIYPSSRFLRF